MRSIAPFGVFVDLGGIDGLVHKSELSWNKVNNPEAGYQIGEEVEAEVIDINHERGRISLSIRRLQPDPWQSTVADLKVGDIVDGTVTKIVNFGAFVRVKDGLEGLIHISELSHQRVAHPGDVVHEGQTLKLKVISLDSERHRLGLSLKQAEEAPARPARERRPRPERGYDTAQAIQEPEGGIDNTLAAAFAQVRQQMAEQDAARTDDDGRRDERRGPPTVATRPAEAPVAEAVAESRRPLSPRPTRAVEPEAEPMRRARGRAPSRGRAPPSRGTRRLSPSPSGRRARAEPEAAAERRAPRPPPSPRQAEEPSTADADADAEPERRGRSRAVAAAEPVAEEPTEPSPRRRRGRGGAEAEAAERRAGSRPRPSPAASRPRPPTPTEAERGTSETRRRGRGCGRGEG